MVGNWLLSAARVFPQEPLLHAPLAAAVRRSQNSAHLSPQPAIATTSKHTPFITRLHVFFICFLYLLLPLTDTNRFTRESSETRDAKAILI